MWKLGVLASYLGQTTSVPDLPISRIVTDSRQVTEASLYVARVGAKSDGHRYLVAAKENGASACLVQDQAAAKQAGLPALVVPDTTRALGWLAKRHLQHLRAVNPQLQVIGITGSVGKTTTKDLLAGLLSGFGPTVAPQLSFNNEVGLPLTVLEAKADTKYLVLEMGASGVGHLAYLVQIAPLDIAVELFVGAAHLGGFNSQQQLAGAKGELLWGLRNYLGQLKYPLSEQAKAQIAYFGQDGFPLAAKPLPEIKTGQVADQASCEKEAPAAGRISPSWIILNADNSYTQDMAAGKQVVRYSAQGKLADLKAEAIQLDQQGCASFLLDAKQLENKLPIKLGLAGKHSVSNALAALATGSVLGLNLEKMAQRLGSLQAISPHRLAISKLAGDITLIDDSYNANLDSMLAGLEVLNQLTKLDRLPPNTQVVKGGSSQTSTLGTSSKSTSFQVEAKTTGADSSSRNQKQAPEAAGSCGRKIAVLGEMLELGEHSASHHQQVLAKCQQIGCEVVITVGDAWEKAIGTNSGLIQCVQTENASAAFKVVQETKRPHDTILIKGSNGSGVWEIADRLTKGETNR